MSASPRTPTKRDLGDHLERLSARLSTKDGLLGAINQEDLDEVRRSLSAAPTAASDALAYVALQNRPKSGEMANLILTIEGVNPNDTADDGCPPLVVAATAGNLDVARELLAAGAHVDGATLDGLTAMAAAMGADNLPMAQLLVGNGADYSHLVTVPRDSQLATVSKVSSYLTRLEIFWRAVTKGDDATVRSFLPLDGFHPGLRNDRGDCVLHAAVRGNHLKIIRLLLSETPDCLSDLDKYGRTALTLAFEKRLPDVILLLLEHYEKPPVKLQANDGTPYLYLMCLIGRIDGSVDEYKARQKKLALIRKILLAAGASVQQALDFIEFNAEKAARLAEKEDNQFAKEMLQKMVVRQSMALSNLIYSSGATVTRVERLVAAKADIEFRDQLGVTPLCHAFLTGNHAVAQYLLTLGACVNVIVDGLSLLSTAACFSSLQIVQAIIDAGATVNATPGEKTPPIIAATQNEDPDTSAAIITTLLAAKAQLDQRGREGMTAVWSATRANNCAALRVLLEAKANPNTAGYNDSPLNVACHVGFIGAASLLVAAKADVTAVDSEDFTPLQHAALSKQEIGGALSQMLFEAGASADQETSRGTALELADQSDSPWFRHVATKNGKQTQCDSDAVPSATPRTPMPARRRVPYTPLSAFTSPLLDKNRVSMRGTVRVLFNQGGGGDADSDDGLSSGESGDESPYGSFRFGSVPGSND